MSFKPRILFLAYPFPPTRAIGGVRCWNLAKFLSRRGWHVEVVAPHPSLLANPDPNVDAEQLCEAEGIVCRWTGFNWRVLTGGLIKSKYWDRLPRLSSFCKRVARALQIDSAIGWNGAAMEACRTIQPGEFDLLLVSGSPFGPFSLANTIAKRLNVPYVLDYRDPWTTNPYNPAANRPAVVQLEKKLANEAAGVIVVSNPWADQMNRRFLLKRPAEVITNGFAQEDFNKVAPRMFDHFAVVYAGQFYPPSRTIIPVLAAIKNANANGGKLIKLHYFGTDWAHVLKSATSLSALNLVVDHGVASRKEVFSAICGAGAVAVVVDVEDATSERSAFIPGKLYEAFGSGQPILLVAAPGSEASKMVHRTQVGKSFSGGQVDGMATWLRALSGGVEWSRGNVKPYSWESLAERTDVFLKAIISRKHSYEQPVGRNLESCGKRIISC
jgi:hypothetical protein